MTLVEEVKTKISHKPIIITQHAQEQALFRGTQMSEIIDNLKTPKRLAYARKQDALNTNEERFDCYFGYSKTQAQRYIIVINTKNIVCTVIKIKRSITKSYAMLVTRGNSK